MRDEVLETREVIYSFKNLEVWKLSRILVKTIYQITAKFPKEELFSLTSQIRRSAISIPSNIAEGHSRHSTKDYINFISISIGSSNELETQIILSQDLGFIAEEEATVILKEIDRLQKMLHKLRNSLKAKL